MIDFLFFAMTWVAGAYCGAWLGLVVLPWSWSKISKDPWGVEFDRQFYRDHRRLLTFGLW